MTGNEVYRKVLVLLGYMENDILNVGQENLFRRAFDIINQICFDLKIPVIKKMSEKIEVSSEKFDALCYGVAMIMSLVEGDSAKNQIFTAIYNAKRATALSKNEKIQDKLPYVSYGVD